MVLPELLRGILASHTLEDCARLAYISQVLNDKRTLFSSWVLLLEVCEVIDVLVDDDVEVVRRLVRRDVSDGKALGHDDNEDGNERDGFTR